MKGFYIIEQHNAATMHIRTHGNKYGAKYEYIYNQQDNENRAAFTAAFLALQAGKINLFYTSQSNRNTAHGDYYRNYTVYHRSPKNPGMIQESRYFTRGTNPEIIACYDCQHATAADAIREGIKSGAYITA